MCWGQGLYGGMSVPPYYFVENLKVLYKNQNLKKFFLTLCAFLNVIDSSKSWSPNSFLLKKFSLTSNCVLPLLLLNLHIKFFSALQHSSICLIEN